MGCTGIACLCLQQSCIEQEAPLLSDSESGGSTSHEQLPFYILVNVISFAVAFTITWFFGYNSKMETGTEKVEQEENIAMNKVDLNENNKVVEITSPLKGEVSFTIK